MIKFITSYNRPRLLMRLLKELSGKVIVLDDGSDYDPTPHQEHCEYYRMKHHGKEGFWKLWLHMLAMAEDTEADEFLFLQDDVYNVDLEGLQNVETPELYALNVMDVGPDRGWGPAGYVDCIFKTNRTTLDAIGWGFEEVDKYRWMYRPDLSSGVGQKLSEAFYRNNIPMILPKRNYASHGDADSKMHPKEREVNPLIAQTGE